MSLHAGSRADTLQKAEGSDPQRAEHSTTQTNLRKQKCSAPYPPTYTFFLHSLVKRLNENSRHPNASAKIQTLCIKEVLGSDRHRTHGHEKECEWFKKKKMQFAILNSQYPGSASGVQSTQRAANTARRGVSGLHGDLGAPFPPLRSKRKHPPFPKPIQGTRALRNDSGTQAAAAAAEPRGSSHRGKKRAPYLL